MQVNNVSKSDQGTVVCANGEHMQASAQLYVKGRWWGVQLNLLVKCIMPI